MSIKAPKKLIEVALPLDAINEAAAREKSIRHGHPSTLHLWWARRPLAAARAVLFAQLVNDPGGERGYYAGKSREQANKEREELFDIIRELVKWENTNNEKVLQRAREAIRRSWRETCEMNKGKPGFDPDKLPPFHDPFAGGGSIPLEAQRLGLEAHASDLNPVAVLINKALIEIPPKFAGRKPVGPLPPGETREQRFDEDWSGAKGLAEDVRRYGAWIREEAFRRIGHLYPKVDVKTGLPVRHGEEKPGQETATVIAWIWARTVKSPNPAYSHVDVPLASTFMLATKPRKEVWVEPVIEGDRYRFVVKNAAEHGKPPAWAKNGTKLARGANFRCILSNSPIEPEYIYQEGRAGRMGTRLLAVVAQGPKGRIYLPPTPEMEAVARDVEPPWRPQVEMPENPRWFSPPLYGLTKFGDIFTPRQLVALNTFSDLILEAREKVREDAVNQGWPDDGIGLDGGGAGASAYADSIAALLAFGLSKLADLANSLCRWEPMAQCPRNLFGRQAIPMVWDYAEGNPLGASSGSWQVCVDGISRALAKVFKSVQPCPGKTFQADAVKQSLSANKVVSTDPPYYDNIGYADLSDFFYVWLRRSLRPIFPELFGTLAVPKEEELVAVPYRHGSKEAAERFFLDGMTRALANLAQQIHPAFPLTLYYAFKEDTGAQGVFSSGWETFLEAVIRAGLVITGTWPIRTENASRMVGQKSNALASSIVLVCRKRDPDAPVISRREFIRELKSVLPQALADMTSGGRGRSPVSPVDLAQAMIGPGMAVFSKYKAVLEADGTPMSVRTALSIINSYLPGDPDEFDADTRFCLAWFEEYGWSTGRFGEADVLARAKGTSVDRVADAGVVESGRGYVRLLRWEEYPEGWSPERDRNIPVWEATHHLIRALRIGGEEAAGALLARMPEQEEKIRQLAYRLYTLCERKGWAEEARAYNELIDAWPGIEEVSHQIGRAGVQTRLRL